MLTIVIPTSNRPHFLREALASVAVQSARKSISAVVVSENGGDRASERVLAEFRDLPLRYVFRSPRMNILEHHQAIFEAEPPSRYTAVLHDDDWWHRDYLATSLQIFASMPDCAVVFQNFFEIAAPTHPARVSPKAWRVWLSADCNLAAPFVRLSPTQVLLSCLLEATFHFSTMVADSHHLRTAFGHVASIGNVYDFDRTLPVFLSQLGGVSFGTFPTAFVRLHPGQDCMQSFYLQSGQDWKLKAETTRWMAARWPDATRAAATLFNQLLPRLDPNTLHGISDAILEPQKSAVIDTCGLGLYREITQPRPRDLKHFLRQLTPPLLLELRRRLLSSRR